MSAALAHMCGLLAGHERVVDERVDDDVVAALPTTHVQSGFLSQHGP